jgi:hypothetical protein
MEDVLGNVFKSVLGLKGTLESRTSRALSVTAKTPTRTRLNS